MIIKSFLLTITLTAMLAQAAAPFDFDVYRIKLRHNEPGKLVITESSVSYQSKNGKTSLTLPLLDIREADVSDPSRITLTTYDVTKRRLGSHAVLSFRLQSGTHGEDVARFFAEHLKRPVVGAYALPGEAAFEILAYHREVLGGSHGKLVVGDKGIRFISKKPKDCRTWLYRDIETIGATDPFHFRVTTYAETFSLDLKERLPEGAYDLAWKSIYAPRLDSHASRE
jgi:hypothetical protein